MSSSGNNVSDLKAKINKSLNALEKKVDKVATPPPVSKPTGKPAKIIAVLLFGGFQHFEYIVILLHLKAYHDHREVEICYLEEEIQKIPNSLIKKMLSLCITDICHFVTEFISRTEFDNAYVQFTTEIFNMMMNQTSLKKLIIPFSRPPVYQLVTDLLQESCLRGLSVLECSSAIGPKFFDKLSQICHDLESLKIKLDEDFSNELVDFLASQNTLKYLELEYVRDIRQSFTQFPNTLTKLHINGVHLGIPFSQLLLISELSNLQELSLSLCNVEGVLKDFNILQYVAFPKLQSLIFGAECPDNDYLIKFLEINGKSLMKLKLCDNIDSSLNLVLGKFCPNLKSLYTFFPGGDVKSLKEIFNDCQQLERLNILLSGFVSQELEILKIVVDCSPANFKELSIDFGEVTGEDDEDGEEINFFENGFVSEFEQWANRDPCIPLSLTFIMTAEHFNFSYMNNKTVADYLKLDVIKSFDIYINVRHRLSPTLTNMLVVSIAVIAVVITVATIAIIFVAIDDFVDVRHIVNMVSSHHFFYIYFQWKFG
ncbi:3929_t:CDS:2 [Funneliformis geosporum]|uniref:3929_t:CDS:1 n=1 Tax=Funneliformis geosporum TaxID=1117311 RepID=A0A9W4SU58_9GLOM|nr:3929_t:CDS:2 [Funneliformis geosporum]